MARKELTASASRYTSRKIRGQGAGSQSWQGRAYDMYHQVPEVRFAASWIGNAMSGSRLFAGGRVDDGTIEPAPDDHRAAQIVAQIAGGPDGQSKMLGAFGKHLTVPGEGWGLDSYPGVAAAARRQQHDRGTLSGLMGSFVAVGHLLQPMAHRGTQYHRHGEAHSHRRRAADPSGVDTGRRGRPCRSGPAAWPAFDDGFRVV
ncbi:hypothetical protein [Streptomyces sp900116325]|uniref:hypothetical protein n=1 Tax=Streptomyces sp. 900116325 TaxID=3154295 RepID=UPI00332D9483